MDATDSRKPFPSPSEGKSITELLSSITFDKGTSTTLKANFFSSPNPKDFEVLTDAFTIDCKKTSVTMKKLWSLFFHHESDLYLKYREGRNETDLNIPPWDYCPPLDDQQGSPCGSRLGRWTVIVDVPTKGTPTPMFDAQRFAYTVSDSSEIKGKGKVACKNLVVQSSFQTPEVMAGTTFRCEVLTDIKCITAPGPVKGCSLKDEDEKEIIISIYGNVKKMSSGFFAVRYMVTPRALAELKSGFKAWADLMKSESAKRTSKGAVEDEKGTEEIKQPPPVPQVVYQPPPPPPPPPPAPSPISPTFGLALVIQAALFFVVFVLVLSSYSSQATLGSVAHVVHGKKKGPIVGGGGDSLLRAAFSKDHHQQITPSQQHQKELPQWASIIVGEVDQLKGQLWTMQWIAIVQSVLLVALIVKQIFV